MFLRKPLSILVNRIAKKVKLESAGADIQADIQLDKNANIQE
jgi:hypothetical protein